MANNYQVLPVMVDCPWTGSEESSVQHGPSVIMPSFTLRMHAWLAGPHHGRQPKKHVS